MTASSFSFIVTMCAAPTIDRLDDGGQKFYTAGGGHFEIYGSNFGDSELTSEKRFVLVGTLTENLCAIQLGLTQLAVQCFWKYRVKVVAYSALRLLASLCDCLLLSAGSGASRLWLLSLHSYIEGLVVILIRSSEDVSTEYARVIFPHAGGIPAWCEVLKAHSVILVTAPQGIGGDVVVKLTVGSQSVVASQTVSYQAPHIISLPAISGPSHSLLRINGRNFGIINQVVPIVRIGEKVCSGVKVVTAHNALQCVCPGRKGLQLASFSGSSWPLIHKRVAVQIFI
jgi:hypothetical protein